MIRSEIQAISRPLGGSALSRDAIAGALSDWYAAPLSGADAWRDAAREVAEEFAARNWLAALEPALEPSGEAERRIRACSAAGGVVVTTGQQPGLFGGPLYVLHKAMTALAVADEMQRQTGIPTAPVFWAATDDTDFAEADHVAVVARGRVQILGGGPSPTPGRAMARTPLGDLGADFDGLAEACGSAADISPLALVRTAYGPDATVGSAYVQLLRHLLHPLGIAVLDASHPALRDAALPVLSSALERAEAIREALRARTVAVRERRLRPQVADVAALSLVFATDAEGMRQRIPVRDAAGWLASAELSRLGPNVLLRPVVERFVMPSAAYVGGPGEIAYFAQVSAVADALGTPWPRILPRWGGTLVEPHVAEILARLDASVSDFADPHAIEGRISRRAISPDVRASLDNIAATLAREAESLDASVSTSPGLQRSVGSMRRGAEYRLARLERRYAASVKQAGTELLHDVASARASLFPDGQPQERALSFMPFLARYGSAVTDAVLGSARAHAASLISGG